MGLTKLFTLFAKPCLTAFLLPSAASISLMLKIVEVSESSVRSLAGIQKHYHNLTVLISSFKQSTCFVQLTGHTEVLVTSEQQGCSVHYKQLSQCVRMLRVQILVRRRRYFVQTEHIFPLLGEMMLKDVSKAAMSSVEKFSLDVYPMPFRIRELYWFEEKKESKALWPFAFLLLLPL